MPWWGWVLVLVVVVWVVLWWARDNPSGYMDRTKGRVSLRATWLDDVDRILNKEPIRMDALLRIEGKLDALASAQRSERVPDIGLERFNARTTRLFELERNLVKDIRATGGKNLPNIGKERWDVLQELGLLDTFGDDEDRVSRQVDEAERILRQVIARPPARSGVVEVEYREASGYEERTEARLERWDEVMDELDELLQRTPWPTGTLARLGGDLDALANEQRQERVPDWVPEWRNVGLTRLFEVDRDLIRDYRTTGGVDSSRLVGARWEFLEALELDQRGLGRQRLKVIADSGDGSQSGVS